MSDERNERIAVKRVRPHELDAFDAGDHDDDENTDHLARLSDPDVLARVEALEREQGGQRYAPRSD